MEEEATASSIENSKPFQTFRNSHGLTLEVSNSVNEMTSIRDINIGDIGREVVVGVEPIKTDEIRLNRCVLEDYKRCSESHLWKLMSSFYDRKGPESWSTGIVPHFITSNTFIGNAYAKVFQEFIRDCMHSNTSIKLDPNEPLYIIELGCGSGKFSYFMLKALELYSDINLFPYNKIVYIMTDFTEKNFQFWINHPKLKPYFDSGRLDAAIFDAVNDSSLSLYRSKVQLSLENPTKNPICVIANYLFDTLYHDIFQVANKQLMEGLISIGSRQSVEEDPLDPDIINRLENLYEYKSIPSIEDYYQNEEGDELYLSRILQWYVRYFNDNQQTASLLLPIGALRSIRRLCRISNHRALVISGDKGNNHPEQFIGLADPHIAVHGSFSLMVNYHAIGAYFTNKGGFALQNPQEEASLKVGCFVMLPNTDEASSIDQYMGENLSILDNQRRKQFPYLCRAFEDHLNAFGPNDFFVLQKSLKEDLSNPHIRVIIAMLKLSDWDPDIFFKFRDAILGQIMSCGIKLRNDLTRGIPNIWENYYQLDVEKDIAFEIGRYYYGIREFKLALQYYQESIKSVGIHHVTFHNQGLCYYSLGELELSLSCFTKAYELSSTYEKAKSWKEKVSNEIDLREKKLQLNSDESILNQEVLQTKHIVLTPLEEDIISRLGELTTISSNE